MITEEIVQIMIKQWNMPESAVREFLKQLFPENTESLDQVREAAAAALQELILETEK
ncbi:MAG: hypothetical protein BroJett040_09670 [Oligoflexia bacterium]|nr:MAG: hypothetical protein BroJett040_09670 [Oligoflexia bacterium]